MFFQWLIANRQALHFHAAGTYQLVKPSTFNLLDWYQRNRSFCSSQLRIYAKFWISFLTDFRFKLKRSLCVVQVFPNRLNPLHWRRLFMAFKLASSTTASHSNRTQSTEGHGFVTLFWFQQTQQDVRFFILLRPDALKLMKDFGFPFGDPRPKRVCILVCWSETVAEMQLCNSLRFACQGTPMRSSGSAPRRSERASRRSRPNRCRLAKTACASRSNSKHL